MAIKRHTTLTAEIGEHSFPIPFEFDEGSEILRISDDGQTARLGVLCRDDFPSDPLEEFDEGEFYQFNRRNIHDCERPELDDFKRLIRANPGRVMPVDSTVDRYRVAGPALTVSDTKGDPCKAESVLDEMDGYYIPPADVADPAEYAKGVLEEYSAWCQGDVYGVCIWEYVRQGDAWELTDRDYEVWGFYGWDFAKQSLNEEMGV
jgi:hypothetical protein